VAGASANGAPNKAGGFTPSGASDSSATISGSPSVTSTGVAPADGGFPGPNDTWNWFGKYRKYPIATVGKLFFTEPSGNFVCSATATYGGNLDTVWTAGHCVGGGGAQNYYSNFQFCPSYDSDQGGVNPAVGCWNWAGAQATSGWYFNGYWSSDYAMLYMSSCGTVICDHVVSAVGGLGLAWNWGRDQHWMDFGYPSGSPYSGGKLVVTAAEHRYDTSTSGDPGPAQNSIGSAQTPGFSGGPWMLFFSGGGAYINSVNSYYFTSGPNGNEYGKEIQGAYYDTTVCNFWKSTTGYTGSC
jgi:hypothetical protein